VYQVATKQIEQDYR